MPIDAGGDLTLGEPPRAQKGWRVQIGGISNSQIPALELSNCAIATSGDLEQYLQFEGKRYSHLIDPRNGYAIEGGSQLQSLPPMGWLRMPCLRLPNPRHTRESSVAFFFD